MIYPRESIMFAMGKFLGEQPGAQIKVVYMTFDQRFDWFPHPCDNHEHQIEDPDLVQEFVEEVKVDCRKRRFLLSSHKETLVNVVMYIGTCQKCGLTYMIHGEESAKDLF